MDEIKNKIINSLTDLAEISDQQRIEMSDQIAQTGDINRVLISQLKLTSTTLIDHYAKLLKLPIITSEQITLYPLAEGVTSHFIRHHKVIPLASQADHIQLITSAPYDPYPATAVTMATGKTVTLCLASDSTISQILERINTDDASIGEISDQIEPQHPASDETDIDRLTNLASEAPIVRLVNRLVAQAVDSNASDIHIEPFEQRLRIRYRIDGVLQEMEAPPLHSAAAIISRIKIMAKLNIAEHRLPQDGRIQIRIQDRQIALRIATIPSLFGESVVIRILDKQQLKLNFTALGLDANTTTQVQSLINQAHGIVLVTGPTGSGKTTTLYTALANLNQNDQKIMTVEDPVEYQLDGVIQMQIKPTIGLSFAQALRSIVRQDPDIIMIGEMRDQETASIAIQAALTGHLVFSTLHTNDAASAITRLIDMGIEPYLITSTIIGIIAQRLVRTLCPHCKTSYPPPADIISKYKLTAYGDESPVLYQATGCDQCNNTGYRGQTIILEQLHLTDQLSAKIISHTDGTDLQAYALSQGMRSMRQDGINKALNGITSLAEVINTTQER